MKGINLNEIPLDIFMKYFNQNSLSESKVPFMDDMRIKGSKWKFDVNGNTMPTYYSPSDNEHLVKTDLEDIYGNSVTNLEVDSTGSQFQQAYLRRLPNNKQVLTYSEYTYCDIVESTTITSAENINIINTDSYINHYPYISVTFDENKINISNLTDNSTIVENVLWMEHKEDEFILYVKYVADAYGYLGKLIRHKKMEYPRVNKLNQQVYMDRFGNEVSKDSSGGGILAQSRAMRRIFDSVSNPELRAPLRMFPYKIGLVNHNNEKKLVYYEEYVKEIKYTRINPGAHDFITNIIQPEISAETPNINDHYSYTENLNNVVEVLNLNKLPLFVAEKYDGDKPQLKDYYIITKMNGGFIEKDIINDKPITVLVYDEDKKNYYINLTKVVEDSFTVDNSLVHVQLERYYHEDNDIKLDDYLKKNNLKDNTLYIRNVLNHDEYYQVDIEYKLAETTLVDNGKILELNEFLEHEHILGNEKTEKPGELHKKVNSVDYYINRKFQVLYDHVEGTITEGDVELIDTSDITNAYMQGEVSIGVQTLGENLNPLMKTIIHLKPSNSTLTDDEVEIYFNTSGILYNVASVEGALIPLKPQPNTFTHTVNMSSANEYYYAIKNYRLTNADIQQATLDQQASLYQKYDAEKLGVVKVDRKYYKREVTDVKIISIELTRDELEDYFDDNPKVRELYLKDNNMENWSLKFKVPVYTVTTTEIINPGNYPVLIDLTIISDLFSDFFQSITTKKTITSDITETIDNLSLIEMLQQKITNHNKYIKTVNTPGTSLTKKNIVAKGFLNLLDSSPLKSKDIKYRPVYSPSELSLNMALRKTNIKPVNLNLSEDKLSGIKSRIKLSQTNPYQRLFNYNKYPTNITAVKDMTEAESRYEVFNRPTMTEKIRNDETVKGTINLKPKKDLLDYKDDIVSYLNNMFITDISSFGETKISESYNKFYYEKIKSASNILSKETTDEKYGFSYSNIDDNKYDFIKDKLNNEKETWEVSKWN